MGNHGFAGAEVRADRVPCPCAAGRVALGWPTPDKADDVRAQHFPAAAKKLLGFGQRPTFRKEAAGIALILLPQCGCRFDPRLGAQQLAIIERVFTFPPIWLPLIN